MKKLLVVRYGTERRKGEREKENKLMGDPAVWLSSEPGATLMAKQGGQATWCRFTQ